MNRQARVQVDPPEVDWRVDPNSSRMVLSPTEQRWALNIKAAIEGTPEIDNLPDFYYGQLALVVNDNVDAALERAQGMQYFREEYGILDTLQESRQITSQLVKLQPGVALSLSYYHRNGNYVFVYDLGAFDYKKATATPESTRTFLAGGLYFCHAQCPDFTAIRKGSILLCECSDFDWRKHLDLATMRKMWTELLIVYPMDFYRMKYFNAGLFTNMINSLKKTFLPKHITDKIETGCRLEDGKLSDMYLVPDLETATRRFLDRVDESLVLRYHNIQTFRLETLQPTTAAALQP
jgi:CRAL/TRIO domain